MVICNVYSESNTPHHQHSISLHSYTTLTQDLGGRGEGGEEGRRRGGEEGRRGGGRGGGREGNR